MKLHHVLRDVPPRRAPAALAARVLRAVERRAALPWWQRGFGAWPAAARVGFVSANLTLAILTAWLGSWSLVAHAIGASRATHQAAAVVAAVQTLAGLGTRLVPGSWIDGALLACAAVYAVLFGLGAIAYRTLFLRPSVAGELQ